MEKVLILFVSLCASIALYGQSVEIDDLQQKANHFLEEADKVSNAKKIPFLYDVINLQDSVYNIIADSLEELASYEKDACIYRFFVRTDVSVFGEHFLKLNSKDLPADLKARYDAISQVKELAVCIDDMERKAEEAKKNPDIGTGDKKEYIGLILKSGIERANNLFDSQEKLNFSGFSKEQKQYNENLKKKFNDILEKYIF